MARCAAVVLLAAALCCAVQAAAAADGSLVLMEGYPSSPTQATEATASISSFGVVGLMHRREHKKHKVPRHHHDYYPEHRQTIQETLAKFERCLKRAAALLDPNDIDNTLPAAGEAFIGCIEQYLDVCIDVPSLDQLVAGIVPAQLLLQGLDVLVQNQDLVPATFVFGSYVAGAGTAGSCAAKLKAALQAAFPHRRWMPNLLHSLAKVLVQILKETLAGNNPLGNCAADVPAVLLSLASSYCPGAETSHAGLLLKPAPGKPVPCNNATGPQYEDGPGALLTGSVLTFMALSEDPKLQKLGLTLAFSMNRLGLAASQTVDYADCLAALNSFLDLVPGTSGFYAIGTPPQVITAGDVLTQKPSDDGRRTLCSTIVALSGETAAGPPPTPFQGSLLHQGNINVWNAIAKAGLTAPLPTPAADAIRLRLCQVVRAAWTPYDAAQDIYYNLIDDGFSGDPNAPFAGCVTRSSMTEPDCRCPSTLPERPSWLRVTRPDVMAGHDFSGPSPSVLDLALFCDQQP